jgi:hypothetical protein
MNELVGQCWNSTNTLVGMGLRAACGWSSFDVRGDSHFIALPGSRFARLANRMGIMAITLGECVFYRSQLAFTRTRVRHELEHVAQGRRWGPAFFPAYLIASLSAAFSGRRIYADNVFERQARAAEPQVKP